jgi:hypothetical protein
MDPGLSTLNVSLSVFQISDFCLPHFDPADIANIRLSSR